MRSWFIYPKIIKIQNVKHRGIPGFSSSSISSFGDYLDAKFAETDDNRQKLYRM
jgi:hypothetical protein